MIITQIAVGAYLMHLPDAERGRWASWSPQADVCPEPVIGCRILSGVDIVCGEQRGGHCIYRSMMDPWPWPDDPPRLCMVEVQSKGDGVGFIWTRQQTRPVEITWWSSDGTYGDLSWPGPADWNGDGTADVADLLAYLGTWFGRPDAAVADLLDWVDLWLAEVSA